MTTCDRMRQFAFILVLTWCCLLESTRTESAKTTNKDGNCDKTIRTTRLIRSPRVTSSNRGKPVHCVYRLLKYGRITDLLYELNFKTFHVGAHHNGSWCSSGYLQIVDHPSRSNASGYFCGRLKYSRTFLAETDHLALIFHADAYTRQTYFRVQASVLPKRLAQERHKELVMNSPGEPVLGTYCDRIYVNCRGFCDVTSPNYPGFYPRNATCRYRVVFNVTDDDDATSSRVVLGGQYYDSFDVWGGPQARDCHSDYCSSKEVTTLCPHDYVRIYDVDVDEQLPVLIQTFCGRGHLPRIASKGTEILVEFTSTAAGSMSNDGFYLSIGSEVLREHVTGIKMNNSACLWSFNSNQSLQGQFHNLRHWYPPGTRCSYRFIGDPHHRLFLHFTYFNANRDADGCRTKLTLYDSDGPDGGSVRGVYCGVGRRQQPNETVLSATERFYVEFDSKTGSYDGSSFEYSVLYTFVNVRQRTSSSTKDDDITVCDETFSSVDAADGGSGGGERDFDFFRNRLRLRRRNVVCTLRFRGRHTERIRLVLARLHFDPTRHCNGQQKQECSSGLSSATDSFDRLLVVNDRKQVVECLCGASVDYLPHEIVSTNSYLEVQLHLRNIPAMAYRDTHAYSFRGRYEFLQVGCGENYLTGKQGQLTFPNLAAHLLPSHVHCRWTIEVAHDKHVFLKFAHLSLQRNCSLNSLRLYAPWSKDLDRDLCVLLRRVDGLRQYEVEPLGWNDAITSKKTAHKVVLELNASSTVTFKLMWTEVGAADRPIDDCDYRCPGSEYCVSNELVCNGVINCPAANASWDPLEESLADCASIGMVWQWVFITFTSSFIVVLIIAASLFWKKTRCAEVDQ